MIDLKDLREHPETYRRGAADKRSDADVDALLDADEKLRALLTRQQELTAEKNRIGKAIGQLAGRLKKADPADRDALQQEMQALQARPSRLKAEEADLAKQVQALQTARDALWLAVPQPAAPDVPVGASAEDNVEIRTWRPDHFDPARPFADNKGFEPRSHIELGQALGLFDLERGVKMAGSRSYVLTGEGMRLHNAVLQYAFRYMTEEHGFAPMSVPVLVREELMVGTGFFPGGKDQAYAVPETQRGGGQDLYLTGTGEVGLMGLHQDEILEPDALPLCYTTLSTCFRREAGAAGKDTAGLYRIHQFDKVEQVVICRADEAESRAWHQKMIGFVETLLQRLGLPYRLLQCCTGDLGPKNADMIDIETWMPSRGPEDAHGRPTGAYGETHSASRLYGYQCRRLNLRYRDPDTKKPVVAHSLNNTVAASPRLLIPILELYQNADGSVTIPEALRPLMAGRERLEPKRKPVIEIDVTSVFKPAGEDLRLLIVHSTRDDLGQNIATALRDNLNNGITVTEQRVATLGDLAQMARPQNRFHVVLLMVHGDRATNQAWLFGDVDIDRNDIGTNAAILKAGLDGLIGDALCLFGICHFGQDLNLLKAAIIDQGGALACIAPKDDRTISGTDICDGFSALLNGLQRRKNEVSIDDLDPILDEKLSPDLRRKLVVITAAT